MGKARRLRMPSASSTGRLPPKAEIWTRRWNRPAAALTLSEQARDQFLRDGRSLTESWLNAAFALTRTQQETAPADDLSLVCSDATPTSFCVMWRYDGSVSNPAR